MRVFNFAAGPATLPLEVLQQAQAEMTDWKASGMSVMEVSHRSKAFIAVAQEAEADLRELLPIPANYKVLFLQGGATGMFSAIPMNLATADSTVDYVNTGRLVEEGHRRSQALLQGGQRRGRRSGIQLLHRARAGRAQALAECRVFPLHAQRDHRRRGVRLRPEVGQCSAGGGFLLHDPVAADRRVEVRPDLRRRAEEHRPVRHLRRDRARRPDRQGAPRHARRVGLQGHGR